MNTYQRRVERITRYRIGCEDNEVSYYQARKITRIQLKRIEKMLKETYGFK